MRILSLRLIVALIVGVTLVSLASSWYEVQAEKEALRRDLERKAEIFGESLAGNAESLLQSGDRPGLERMVQRFNNRVTSAPAGELIVALAPGTGATSHFSKARWVTRCGLIGSVLTKVELQ